MPRKPPDSAPVSGRRRDTHTGRTIRQNIATKFAADAIGQVTPGCSLFGLSMGRFSLVDVITHVLSQTGPAEVDLVTWTAGGNDITFAHGMLANGNITRLRFLTDYSFPARNPSYCAALRERFGDDAIRLTKNHAKWVTVTNQAWNIAIRTSMNFNENPTLEWWELSDDPQLAGFLRGVLDRFFEQQQDTFDRDAAEFCDRFGEELEEFEPHRDTRYFGDGPVDVDLRRIGPTYRS